MLYLSVSGACPSWCVISLCALQGCELIFGRDSVSWLHLVSWAVKMSHRGTCLHLVGPAQCLHGPSSVCLLVSPPLWQRQFWFLVVGWTSFVVSEGVTSHLNPSLYRALGRGPASCCFRILHGPLRCSHFDNGAQGHIKPHHMWERKPTLCYGVSSTRSSCFNSSCHFWHTGRFFFFEVWLCG